MDMKTLETLKLRVLQAERIVEKLDELKNNIEAVHLVTNVEFVGETRLQPEAIFDTTTGNLVEQMKIAYIQAAQEEIVLLEQDLAAL